MVTKSAVCNIYERILSKFPDHFSFAFAYGSGVFAQHDHSDTKDNMIDFIFAVDDPEIWHRENIKKNKKHYSFLKHGGAQIIRKIQQDYGAKMYFNTLIPVENRLIKYGVISTDNLIEDLLDWRTLYISGRMHKPVKVIREPQNEDIIQAINLNLQSALHASLLYLPETFSEEQLFMHIAGLSYAGDFRMYFGEDKQKVSNLVKPQLERFRMLYEIPLSRMPLLHWNKAQGTFEQDCSPTSLLHHLNLLPRTVQSKLLVTWNKDGRHLDLEEVLQAIAYNSECGDIVLNALCDIVWWSSWSQSCKGIFTAGILKSLKYSLKKLSKMVHSLRHR